MVVKTAKSCKAMESKVGFKTVGIGGSVRTTLVSALAEGRTVVGMTNAIRQLREDPQQFTFCFMAPSEAPDSGSHMQEVLLEAFCFEHDIYIIKVDSAEKLSRLVQSNELAWCALVQKSAKKKECRSETILIDHCELYWDEPTKPIIKLPEK